MPFENTLARNICHAHEQWEKNESNHASKSIPGAYPFLKLDTLRLNWVEPKRSPSGLFTGGLLADFM